MRVGCIFTNESPAQACYRASLPLDVLAARDHEVVWCEASDRNAAERLRECDVVHVQRASTTRVVRAMEELAACGVGVNWDNDDDIKPLPKAVRDHYKLHVLADDRYFAEKVRAIRRADLVTTTSRALAEQYRDVGAAQVRIIENYLPQRFLGASSKRTDGLTIGWVAAIEHIADAKMLHLNDALRDVLDAHPHVRVVTVGLDIRLDHERYEHWPGTSLNELIGTIRAFDIGLAPLADIRFNRCRSTIKLKEYAAVGIPWLASPVGEYAQLGARQGGRLVADDQWREMLDRMIRSPVHRAVLARRGRRWAKRQTMELNVGEWERAFEEAIMLARQRREQPAPRVRLRAS